VPTNEVCISAPFWKITGYHCQLGAKKSLSEHAHAHVFSETA
jgi:hypothetical protein